MKILPYDNFTIVTPDSLPLVLQRLNQQVEPTKIFRFSRKHLPYEGTVSEQGFKISRIIHYRNSFLPVIRGRFDAQPHQTIVHVEMSLHSFVMAFLCCWFLFWYAFSVPLAFTAKLPTLMVAAFLGMPLLLLVICLVAFWVEAKRSRKELSQIIQGQIYSLS